MEEARLYASEALLSKYPRAGTFMCSPAYKKCELVCALLEKFLQQVGSDGYVETTDDVKKLLTVLEFWGPTYGSPVEASPRAVEKRKSRGLGFIKKKNSKSSAVQKEPERAEEKPKEPPKTANEVFGVKTVEELQAEQAKKSEGTDGEQTLEEMFGFDMDGFGQ